MCVNSEPMMLYFRINFWKILNEFSEHVWKHEGYSQLIFGKYLAKLFKLSLNLKINIYAKTLKKSVAIYARGFDKTLTKLREYSE